MRGRGSDLGGRWPVGIWFALVGVSAGTVASFAMLGWTFTRGLYTGGEADEPVQIDSGTVIIEGEEPPAEPGDVEGLAGGDPLPEGLAEPGAGVDPEPAEPQAEPLPEPADEPGPPVESDPVEEGGEQSEPPKLVPVEEEPPCDPGESTGEPAPDWDDWQDDWESDWPGEWGGPGWDWSREERGAGTDPAPELELELELQAPQATPTDED
ncbi:hypothetical protein [Glycomyces terrestris]|uniref:Uncharacterized protein n=1 Tax=Glycomyces terrestris TaxID=2493553 RepID=A0A426URY2_9ACTN|nr:hypothetical protein [Glycomyces terrestris]RRR96020.1 hypothetical protein EIW28_22400 [Glycomyces terrestris]